MGKLFLPFLLLAAFASAVTVTEIWAAPLGTWIENLYETQSGQILATTLTHPHVYQIDPCGKKPTIIIAKIPHHKATVGITEVSPNVFYVATTNFTQPASGAFAGTSALYTFDLNKFNGKDPLTATLGATLPKAGVLNGITTLDITQPYVLAADSFVGTVWRLNVKTGAVKELPSNSLMKKVSYIGINGIKLHGNNLFWTNTDKNLLATWPITAEGIPTGKAAIVANVTAPDDFNLGPFGEHATPIGFFAGNNQLRYFKGANVTVVSSSKLLEGSTACRVERYGADKGRVVYVTTNGGPLQYAPKNFTSPGKVLKVMLD